MRQGADMKENLVSEQNVMIGFRGSPEFRHRIQLEALNRGVKMQKLIEDAIESYLKGDDHARKSKVAAAEAEWINALVAYLRDDDRPHKQNMLTIMASILGLDAKAVNRVKRKAG